MGSVLFYSVLLVSVSFLFVFLDIFFYCFFVYLCLICLQNKGKELYKMTIFEAHIFLIAMAILNVAAIVKTIKES